MPLSRRARLLAAVAALTSALAVALAGASHSAAASGCDRVAAPTGSDSAAGTESSPYQTAQKLIDSLSAGQTGCLRAGSYTQPRLRFAHGGASGSPLTLQSYPGERATLHGIVEIASGSNFVTLRALDIDGSGIENATLWVMSFDDTIEDSDITNANTGTQCLILGGNGWGGPSGRLLIQRNRIHNCGRYSAGNQEHAIYFENTIDTRVIDNLFWGAAAFAIHLYPNAQRTLVAHNVIDANRQGVVFSGSTSYTSNNNTVAYNIITNTSTDDNVRSWWGGSTGTGNTAHDNCLYNGHYNDFGTQTGYTATNNLHADPHYTNPTTHDYRLPTTSPCLPIIGYDTATKLAGSGPGQGDRPSGAGPGQRDEPTGTGAPTAGAAARGGDDPRRAGGGAASAAIARLRVVDRGRRHGRRRLVVRGRAPAAAAGRRATVTIAGGRWQVHRAATAGTGGRLVRRISVRVPARLHRLTVRVRTKGVGRWASVRVRLRGRTR